jgi:hypothetical protein
LYGRLYLRKYCFASYDDDDDDGDDEREEEDKEIFGVLCYVSDYEMLYNLQIQILGTSLLLSAYLR